ncbi:MAG: hypothetical protein U1E36_04535 [Rickettsiales bacterium]
MDNRFFSANNDEDVIADDVEHLKEHANASWWHYKNTADKNPNKCISKEDEACEWATD